MRQRTKHALERLFELPLFLLITGAYSVLMLVPAAYALAIDLEDTARSFFYAAVLSLFGVVLFALALNGRSFSDSVLGPLASLCAAFSVLPLILALPFHEALGTTSFLNAYLEMVSAMTTTGATLFDPARLDPAMHLWRACVAWIGGFIMWVAAAAVLAPLNLGGVEITARAQIGQMASVGPQFAARDMRIRLARVLRVLAPSYIGLTALLAGLLTLNGEAALVAVCHAMSVMATSGISPVGGVENAGGGTVGELLLATFMVFGISRLTFSSDTVTSDFSGLARDPEVRLAAAVLIAVPFALFVRHWLGAATINEAEDLTEALAALWGSVFTVLSFLTTTGFVSGSWETAEGWSGLNSTGLVLMGLAVIGGGVATTAGGVKLLRVFALYVNGRREMERLIHPSSVTGAGPLERRMQRGGAFIAWVFFMLFAVSLAALCLAFAAYNIPFQESMVVALAGLSTTGPLLDHAGEAPISLAIYDTGPKLIFCVAMIVGRLETLAIIALITPGLWRN